MAGAPNNSKMLVFSVVRCHDDRGRDAERDAHSGMYSTSMYSPASLWLPQE